MSNKTPVRLEVFAGICGFTTQIETTDQGSYNALLSLETDCPNFQKVAGILGTDPLNVMNELFKKDASRVLEVCNNTIPHVSCPVPTAILKALEVTVGLALPCDPTITFKS